MNKKKKFVADNYVKEKLTFKTGREMLFAFFITAISGLVFGLPFYLLWSEKVQDAFNNTEAVDLQTRLIAVGIFLFANACARAFTMNVVPLLLDPTKETIFL